MQQKNDERTIPVGSPQYAKSPLQLLLFIDNRPHANDYVQRVRNCLAQLQPDHNFALEVINVGDQPYLAEHFRLVATPSLVKLLPEPRQTLAGSDLIAQIRHWWPYWQELVQQSETPNGTLELPEVAAQTPEPPPVDPVVEVSPPSNGKSGEHPASSSAIAHSAEVIRLSDEIFQLQHRNQYLEHQLKFKDQIIAMLAHDLRNPLTAASIAIETLQMGHDLEGGWSPRMTAELINQLLQHARTQTRSMERMITEILQTARGDNAEMQISPERLDLRELCLEVLQNLRDRFDSKAQTLHQDLPSDLPAVLADKERVRQVITNLLDNANKYTPNHGAIKLMTLHRTTQKVQVSICDDGPGIPEENQLHIFDDQYRLQRDAAKDGYGIGLSSCKRIIRAHYGRLWVESRPNQGSCFHFTLPVFR